MIHIYKINKLFIIIFSLLFVCIVSLSYAAENWQRKSSSTNEIPIPNEGDQQTCCLILDVDKDGTMDFVVGERTQTPSIVWYKYNGDGWDKFIIDDTRLNPEAGGDVHDIDNDGDMDIILGQDYSGNQIWWWENPYPNFDKPWTRHIIKNSGGRKHHDQSVADYDGDGQPELVSWNQGAKKLLLFEIPDDPRSKDEWESREIFSWDSGQEMEGFPSIPVDVDLDGQVDIVGGGRWFKHNGNHKFEAHVIDDSLRFTQCAAGQLVKGGRPEIVFSPGDMDGEVKWFEWKNDRWESHVLREIIHGHTCEVGDVDGDGNLDIMIGEMGNPGAGDRAKTFVYYGDGNGNFRESIVSEGQGIHEGKLADLNNDGHLDILMKPYNHNSPRIDILLNQQSETAVK